MNLSLTDEQVLLRDTFARFFEREATIERLRGVSERHFDPALWSALVEMGAHLARVPEEDGGLGLSLLDAAIVAEEAGKRIAAAPLIEVMVAARLLAGGGAPARDWLERLQGGAIVAFAPQPVAGGCAVVPGGGAAEAAIVLDGDEVVFLSGDGVLVARENSGDLPIADCKPDRAAERIVLASGQGAHAVFEAAVLEWKLLTAAWLGGLCRQALDLAAAYACERIQFGRAIGGFQGIAHPLADGVSDVEGGQLLVWKAIAAVAAADRDAAALAVMASWWMGRAAFGALRPALRTLGGYGLSLEYDLQLYHRRGIATALLPGDPEQELALAGDLLFGHRQMALPASGAVDIRFGFSPASLAHMDRLRAFFGANWDERMRAKAHHSSRSHDSELHRQLALNGFIFGSWPAEHGGSGLGAAEDFATTLVFEEWNYTSHVLATTNMVGQVVMRFGSPEAQAEILPRIRQGEAVGSLGFSEPAAGSDVFAAKTSARRDGADWVINGQKMFTTAGHYADYVLLLARTDASGRKHEGLTLFVVPTRLPGYEFQAVETYQDERTNITYYTDLRLPDCYRLGGVGEGAAVLGAVLELEHGGANYFSGLSRAWRSAIAWATEPGRDEVRPIDNPRTRARLAAVRARTEVADCHVVRGIAGTEPRRHWGSMAKLFITESFLRNCTELLELAGADGIFTGDHPLGLIELDHRRAYGATIYGGASEIHRSVVAEQALGLPKSRS